MALELDQILEFEDGVSIRWTSFGTGPPLIFVHGTPWSSQLWAPIARCFASKFSVYLFDMPGYGQSMPAADLDFQSTYPAQTQAFCALLRHWQSISKDGTFEPHVVAHDIGGHVVLRAALMENVKFKSAILVDCGASHPVDEPFFSLVRENPHVFTSLPSTLHEAMVREYIRGASHRGLRKRDEDMLMQPWQSQEGQKAFYRQIGAQKNSDIEVLRKNYRKFNIPLHIIWAKQDTWVPVERASMLQKFVGGSLKIIENAGHLIQLDAPEELLAEIMNCLQ